MKQTIRSQLFFYMLGFSSVIVLAIAAIVIAILPNYYLDHQKAIIEKLEADLKEKYEGLTVMEVSERFEDLQEILGGQIYAYDEYEDSKGDNANAKGFRKNAPTEAIQGHIESGEDVSSYIRIDKRGNEIYTLGVHVGTEYLIYEVSLQSINQASQVMLPFILALLGLTWILAIILALSLSRKLASPIRQLNEMTVQMKKKGYLPYEIDSDVQEIRQLNQKLNNLYKELQANIEELDMQLNKERDIEASKKRFLAQATHELKTPIAVIRGFSEILYDGMYKDEEERERLIKNIYDETDVLSKLILDVLDYSRLESKHYNLTTKNVDVVDFLKRLNRRYRPFIENQKLSFEVYIDIEKEWTKELDEKRMEQVYKNLLINAIEHAKTKITVRAMVESEKLQISIFNDGPPIAKEDIDHIFESFYKNKGKKSGSGLGLAIVKEILVLHRGSCFVENTENGVVFIILV